MGVEEEKEEVDWSMLTPCKLADYYFERKLSLACYLSLEEQYWERNISAHVGDLERLSEKSQEACE